MELVTPSHPPTPAGDRFSGFSSPANIPNNYRRMIPSVTSPLPEICEGGGDKVYVAVGKSVDKASSLLNWTFKRFGNHEICILHVHQPSPFIPTLLGKLPASQANAEVVSAYRREEREQMKKLMLNYLSICSRLKVKASVITNDANQVPKGILDMLTEHSIRKLVMGAGPVNRMKVKKSSSKASYVAKNSPSFCEIWFVNKGTLLWTKAAAESTSSVQTVNQSESAACILRSDKSGIISDSRSLWPMSARFCAGTITWDQAEADPRAAALSPVVSSSMDEYGSHYLHSLSSSSSGTTGSEQGTSSDSETKVEEESLCRQLEEFKMEAEASRNVAFIELLKRKKLEAEALEAIEKVKAFESAHAHEVEFKREAEDGLRTIIQEQEKLLEEREEIMRQRHKTMRSIALLDRCAHEANRRCEDAADELKLIQASIATLRREKQKILRQKMEATRWLKKHSGEYARANFNEFIGFDKDPSRLAEFSLSDLQTATCDFAEGFKIGHGGYGSVYKGEMLDRTVAIKKLHPQNMLAQSDFQQEVQILRKLEHPHMVTLIGTCFEAWALVYEYLPNGSLQDRLFRKSTIHSLNWKTRARIISEIASALLFLHSSKPGNIVHGDLKPENILLNSELRCKISDFGICRLVPEGTLRCPSFRQYTEPKGAFPYTDPEFRRTGILTPSSDIYSFGLIILQLLTGRTPAELTIEVRKAVSYGKLASILDSSAGEWPSFVARRLVDLGLQCSELNSRDRPKLTPSLVRELEQLHGLEDLLVPSIFLCPILHEMMHDPQVAADGFTYEGEALRGWLENGHDTSPMTNLKLGHLNLTPNHALRIAIQDWLCNC